MHPRRLRGGGALPGARSRPTCPASRPPSGGKSLLLRDPSPRTPATVSPRGTQRLGAVSCPFLWLQGRHPVAPGRPAWSWLPAGHLCPGPRPVVVVAGAPRGVTPAAAWLLGSAGTGPPLEPWEGSSLSPTGLPPREAQSALTPEPSESPCVWFGATTSVAVTAGARGARGVPPGSVLWGRAHSDTSLPAGSLRSARRMVGATLGSPSLRTREPLPGRLRQRPFRCLSGRQQKRGRHVVNGKPRTSPCRGRSWKRHGWKFDECD